MNYPNRVIKRDESSSKIVKAVQSKLNELGCGPIDVDGDFGKNTFNAVKLFQARNVDSNGNPLIVDGKLGPLSWEALFGNNTVPVITVTDNDLLNKVLEISRSQINVRETPGKQNQGPEVNEYLASVGLSPGNAWCMAFVYWCFKKASEKIGRNNPALKTGGCLFHWNGTSAKKIKRDDAVNSPSKIKPGQIFIMDFGGGLGHTGIVEKINGGMITTIEGNTDPAGSRNGYGVFRRERKINSINKGFIEYK
ncbi:MAG TPA: CHAP domain-containing protein [Ignavibacteria bacterium]|nr:CHAP domain-containing protein [Ignavibacteria bacterium]